MSSFFLPFLLGHENASGACSEAEEVHLLGGIRQKQSGRWRAGAGISPEAVPSREAQKKDEELRGDGVGSALTLKLAGRRTPRISKE